jgi:hypothetical protein
VSERLGLENLFKQNKKPPAKTAVSYGFKPSKFRLLNEEEKVVRRKFFQRLAVMAVFLLGFIVTLGFIKKQTFLKEQPVVRLEKKSDYILAEISGLAKVDPFRSMELALDLKKLINDSRKDIVDKKLLDRLNRLLQKLDNVQSELGLVRQAKLAEFLDPKLLKEGISAEILSGNGDRLLIFDPKNNILATVSPGDRNGQVIGGGIEGIKGVALGRNSAFGIKENTIIEFPYESGESAEVVNEEEAWDSGSILTWFGGSLYVIDKFGSEILKYPAVENTTGKSEFGSRRRWFKPGLNYDLSDAVGVEVDGDIWVLHRDGEISRFRNGSRISFKQVLAGFISEPDFFSVSPEGEKIWVLGRKEKKVVAISKETGEFAGLLEAEEFEQARGLAVNEKLGKMFVLIEGKIYVAEVK